MLISWSLSGISMDDFQVLTQYFPNFNNELDSLYSGHGRKWKIVNCTILMIFQRQKSIRDSNSKNIDHRRDEI